MLPPLGQAGRVARARARDVETQDLGRPVGEGEGDGPIVPVDGGDGPAVLGDERAGARDRRPSRPPAGRGAREEDAACEEDGPHAPRWRHDRLITHA